MSSSFNFSAPDAGVKNPFAKSYTPTLDAGVKNPFAKPFTPALDAGANTTSTPAVAPKPSTVSLAVLGLQAQIQNLEQNNAALTKTAQAVEDLEQRLQNSKEMVDGRNMLLKDYNKRLLVAEKRLQFQDSHIIDIEQQNRDLTSRLEKTKLAPGPQDNQLITRQIEEALTLDFPAPAVTASVGIQTDSEPAATQLSPPTSPTTPTTASVGIQTDTEPAVTQPSPPTSPTTATTASIGVQTDTEPAATQPSPPTSPTTATTASVGVQTHTELAATQPSPPAQPVTVTLTGTVFVEAPKSFHWQNTIWLLLAVFTLFTFFGWIQSFSYGGHGPFGYGGAYTDNWVTRNINPWVFTTFLEPDVSYFMGM
ncbi:hypothetical protein E2P81_ATG09838 [Venturia nashicola]|nr:hypothetical protein E2P81_ATG09838 [Venturia nashicola]